MADTVVYEQSPAYAVLEFRHASPDTARHADSSSTTTSSSTNHSSDSSADAEQRQHELVEALEEAGILQKLDNETLLDVAPATREKLDDEEGGHADHSAGPKEGAVSASARTRSDSARVRRISQSADQAAADAASGVVTATAVEETVLFLNSGNVPATGALLDLIQAEVHLALEAIVDAETVINRDVVAIDVDEKHHAVTKRGILDGLAAAGFEIAEVSDGKSIVERLQAKVANGYETAFYIMDVDVVLRKHKQWMALLNRVNIRYAIKCCPDPVLLKVMHLLGAGFDVASQAEIQLALAHNTPTDMIIFANPCKPKSHIAFARDHHVKMMTFDNAAELIKIKETFPDAELVLRMLPPNNTAAVCNFGSKFGASLRESEQLLTEAKQLGLHIVGVSFHVGSGCFTLTAYEDALKQARHLFDMGLQHGFKMRLLDIGGGFPGDDDGALTFTQIANCIGPMLDQLFPKDVEVVAEPGRYFASACMTLAANVVSRRERIVTTVNEAGQEVDTDERSFLYYISDGVYGSFNCIFFDHAVPQPSVLQRAKQSEAPKKHSSTLFGPTCDSIDLICKDVEMPELEVGDWLYFLNMGAYTRAAGSNFNGFNLPKVFYICS